MATRLTRSVLATVLVAGGLGLAAWWWLDPAQMRPALTAIAQVPPATLLLASGLLVLRFGTKVMRLVWLLPPGVAVREIAAVFGATLLANQFTALRLGVIARPYLLAKASGHGLATGVAVTLADRVLDLASLVCLMAASGAVTYAMWSDAVPSAAMQAGWVIALLAVAVAAVMGLLHPRAPWPRALRPAVQKVRTALILLGSHPGRALGAGVLSVVDHALAIGSTRWILQAIPGISSSWSQATQVWGAGLIATAATPTPAGFGGFEAAGAAVLVSQGTEHTLATAAAFAVHVLPFAVQALLAVGVVVSSGTARSLWRTVTVSPGAPHD